MGTPSISATLSAARQPPRTSTPRRSLLSSPASSGGEAKQRRGARHPLRRLHRSSESCPVPQLVDKPITAPPWRGLTRPLLKWIIHGKRYRSVIRVLQPRTMAATIRSRVLSRSGSCTTQSAALILHRRLLRGLNRGNESLLHH